MSNELLGWLLRYERARRREAFTGKSVHLGLWFMRDRSRARYPWSHLGTRKTKTASASELSANEVEHWGIVVDEGVCKLHAEHRNHFAS